MPLLSQLATPFLTEAAFLPDGAAVFLDRDGVINRRRPDHVKSWSEFDFLPGTLDALASFHRIGARIVVVTNQAVVGRGLLSDADLAFIHARMAGAVALAGGLIERTYACVHVPEMQCQCRKPGAALLMQASAELGIRLEASLMVGDALSDVQAARSAGCFPILVASDEEPGHRDGIAIVRQLSDVVTIYAQMRNRLVALC
ncbi:MAG TPA: HAD family hydrolase [Hyphomicrobiaceae bacterium]|jgi:histidinol-phosphate phosphatase family protein|nr:HAD family hydrolase [Hyphomicrobiaceae bacterium]